MQNEVLHPYHLITNPLVHKQQLLWLVITLGAAKVTS